MMARAEQCRKKRPPLRDWILGHGELMAKLLRYVPAKLKNFGMLNPVTRFALDKLGISAKAPMPAFAEKSFRQQLKKSGSPIPTSMSSSSPAVIWMSMIRRPGSTLCGC